MRLIADMWKWSFHKGRQTAAAVVSVCAILACGFVREQAVAQALDTDDWLQRIDDAARTRNYRGIYVVAQPDQLISFTVTHIVEQGVPYMLVTRLDGPDQQMYKVGDTLYSVFPQNHGIWQERQSHAQIFPSVLKSGTDGVFQEYGVTAVGVERIAGRMAQVLEVRPRDEMRFGYKAWVDESSGLLLQLQVRDIQDRVLEQIAFVSLTEDLSSQETQALMQYASTLKARGYEIHEFNDIETSPEQEGWSLNVAVPGFESVRCMRRPYLQQGNLPLLQWVFSDGLVSVSIFIEPLALQEGPEPQRYSYGATNVLAQQHGQWWVTLVGEVPEQALDVFAQNLMYIPAEPSH